MPTTRAFVVDQAHLLDMATAEQLEGWLETLQDKTTAQVKLLTVPSLDGDDIFHFSQREYQLWALGTKKASNGALIVVAVAEHKLRIHTGYGLEGALPDSWCGSLSRQIVADYFHRGAFANGIRELVISVVNKVAAEYGTKIEGLPPPRIVPQAMDENAGPADVGTALMLIVIVLVVLYILYLQQNRRGGFSSGPTVLPGGTWGSPSGGWSSGPWSGGTWGGGGGDWGGGGGSFGGGGRSGGGGGGASW